MVQFLKKEYPWFLAHALWFWCVPLIGGFLDSADQTGLFLLLMMIGNPFFCIITGLFYGLKYGKKWGFLLYPTLGGIVSMFMYYNTSAFAFVFLAVCCSLIGLIFGSWSRSRKMTEAEKWSEKSGLPSGYFKNREEEAQFSANSSDSGPKKSESETVSPRIPSKTALKNQQKAYARKAKERAEKEAKLHEKNAPKKKKKGGH